MVALPSKSDYICAIVAPYKFDVRCPNIESRYFIAGFDIKPSNIESRFDIRWHLDSILDASTTI